jgi:hypothetical protein
LVAGGPQVDRGIRLADAFGEPFPRPTCPVKWPRRIIVQHLQSPAMWAIFPLQDLLAIDENLRHPDPDAERINVPAIMPYYWRYRMHLGLAELAAADDFNGDRSSKSPRPNRDAGVIPFGAGLGSGNQSLIRSSSFHIRRSGPAERISIRSLAS